MTARNEDLSSLRVAAVSWKVRSVSSLAEFLDHLSSLVEEAVQTGAQLTVFPELVILELASLHPGVNGSDLPAVMEQYAEPFENTIAQLEKERGCAIVAGSHIRRNQNVCRFGGSLIPKMVLTQWEKVSWGMDGGDSFDQSTEHPLVGVSICYDCEFPGAGRTIAERGSLVHCIPAYTETRYGFQRVRWCAHARAIENQVFVVHASLVGGLGVGPVLNTYGTSAIITPSVPPFPESCILAETTLNQEGIAVADLDFAQLLECRETGDVRNWHDRDVGKWLV